MRLLIVLSLFAVIAVCNGEQCSMCLPSGHACLSEKTFMPCSEGRLDTNSTVMSCPADLNCTEAAVICALGPPACFDKCKRCNDAMSIACMDRTTFALCMGTPTPSQIMGTCPSGSVCNNVGEGGFCIPPEPGFREASCISQSSVTTPSPSYYPGQPIQPAHPGPGHAVQPAHQGHPGYQGHPGHQAHQAHQGHQAHQAHQGHQGHPTTASPYYPVHVSTGSPTYNYQYHTPIPTTAAPTPPPMSNLPPPQQCASRSKPGRYAADFKTCKTYLYCYVQSGGLTGQVMPCPGNTVFNPDIQKCVAQEMYPCQGAHGGMV